MSQGASSVWAFDGQIWRSYKLGAPAFLNSLNTLQPGVGYYVFMP